MLFSSMLDGLPLHATKLQQYNMQLTFGRKANLPGINKKVMIFISCLQWSQLQGEQRKPASPPKQNLIPSSFVVYGADTVMGCWIGSNSVHFRVKILTVCQRKVLCRCPQIPLARIIGP